jgi:hypothetical protein
MPHRRMCYSTSIRVYEQIIYRDFGSLKRIGIDHHGSVTSSPGAGDETLGSVEGG